MCLRCSLRRQGRSYPRHGMLIRCQTTQLGRLGSIKASDSCFKSIYASGSRECTFPHWQLYVSSIPQSERGELTPLLSLSHEHDNLISIIPVSAENTNFHQDQSRHDRTQVHFLSHQSSTSTNPCHKLIHITLLSAGYTAHRTLCSIQSDANVQ